MLSVIERESLRFRLENHVNDLELLLLNEKADQSDRERLDLELATFRVFERIPVTPKKTELKEQVREQAKSLGCQLVEFKHSFTKSVHGNLAKELRISFKLKPLPNSEAAPKCESSLNSLKIWNQQWKKRQLRIVGFEAPIALPENHVWQVRGVAYSFLAQSPNEAGISSKPMDPVLLLPSWARRDTSRFAKKAPELWSLIQKAHELTPRTLQNFKKRAYFELKRKRFEFFFTQDQQGLSRRD